MTSKFPIGLFLRFLCLFAAISGVLPFRVFSVFSGLSLESSVHGEAAAFRPEMGYVRLDNISPPAPIPSSSNPIQPNDTKISYQTAHSNLIKPDQA
jgi:hypothetical protein